MGVLFTIFYQPVLNLFYFILGVFSFTEVWLGVLILVLIIKIILLPISIKTLKIQSILKEIQPRLNELKKNSRLKKQEQAEGVMKIYKEKNISILSPFIAFFQLPFFLTLFFVLKNLAEENGFQTQQEFLYRFVSEGFEFVEVNSFIFNTDLFVNSGIVLAIIVVLSQLLAVKVAEIGKSNVEQPAIQKNIIYGLLVLIFITTFFLPGVICLFWIFTNLIGAVIDFSFLRRLK